MKKIVFVMSLLLTTALAFGQSAKSVLDKTASVVSNKSGVQANFTMSGGMGNVSGTIAVKGRKFHATTPVATMWFDGKTMWTYMKKNEEVNVTTPNETQLQKINPYNFINLYKQGYDMTMSQSDKSYTVHLTAQKTGKISELFITVDKKSYHPTQVKMLQGNKWTVFDINSNGMKKFVFTILIAMGSCMAGYADDDKVVTVNGQTTSKPVTKLTFIGDNIVLHFNDGTTQAVDMSNVVITFNITDAVKALASEPKDAPVCYFDLNGRQLKSAPKKGSYIMRKGNKVVKLLTT